jgi:hypothetical protein
MKARSRIALGLVAAAAVCAGAPASAGIAFPDAQYEGRIAGDPYTYVGFDLKRSKGKRAVKAIRAMVPIACHAGYVEYLPIRVKGRIAVRANGRFGATRRAVGLGLPDGVNLRVKLRGRLGKGGKAKGTIAGKGDVSISIRRRGPATDKCYTGGQNWRARRGAEVVPIPIHE